MFIFLRIRAYNIIMKHKYRTEYASRRNLVSVIFMDIQADIQNAEKIWREFQSTCIKNSLHDLNYNKSDWFVQNFVTETAENIEI